MTTATSRDLNQEVIAHYAHTYWDYFFLLRLWRHWGMHYGYYDAGHRTLDEAILNMNRVLAQKAGIQPGMKVLDAGCGVGGSALWLAKNAGAHVTSITIVEQQCRKAKKLAEQYGLADKVEFFVRDYRKTGFPDATFDVVWGIESVGYAEDKKDFLREAKRILKPGGRLVISDGFCKFRAEDFTPEEREMMNKIIRGWAIPGLTSISEFVSAMEEMEFRNIRYEDVTKNVFRFSKWLYHWGIIIAYPTTKLLEWLKLRSKIGTGNVVAAIWQYKTLKRGLWAYMIFTAEK